MALIQRSCSRLSIVSTRFAMRSYSKSDLVLEKDIKKSVFISQSKDVYTNLALKEWMYKNFDFKKHHVLMLWQNDPCIVIGKHQNPWSETNFSELDTITTKGVKLARRNSSGGALYHDDGCLNFTFFLPKEVYNSKKNLEVISRGVFREYGVELNINSEDDLIIRKNKQVSFGNAGKLGRENSYQNCMLMVRTNKVNQTLALHKHDVDIKTNARKISTNSKMMNLCEEGPQVTLPDLIKAVGWEFLRTKALTQRDGGMEFASKQKGFQMINPSESYFPGIDKIRNKYSSWEWCYGKTPKFNITKTFLVPGGLIHSNTGASADLKVTMTVEQGRISDITLFVPYGFSSLGFTGEANVIHGLKGKKFSVDAFADLEDSLGCLLDEKDRFVTQCLKQVMSCA